jgi:TRAP-type uncharacterized transport system substrate-binding protein/ABC-type arginine transport system permease subunit
MTGSDNFVTAFLLGFLTNLWVGAAALMIGTALGAPLAWLRHRSRWMGRPAAGLTALLRAAPTFVVMFFLLNVMPQGITILSVPVPIPNVAVLVLALAIYITAYVSDNLLDTLRYLDAGSIGSALLFVPKMLRAFFVLVMSSSVGAAIGVQEAVTITLRQADRLPTIGSRIVLVIGVILFFSCVMQVALVCARRLTHHLNETYAARSVASAGLTEPREEQPVRMHDLLHPAIRYGGVAMVILLLFAGAGFIAPLPPKQVTIETGPMGGSWYQSAVKYRDYLEARGIRVKLRPRNDTLAIAEDVNQTDADTDIGFVIDPPGPKQIPNVVSLGSIEYQPLFAFVRRSAAEVTAPAQLRGMRITFPPRDSATAGAAQLVLRAFGVTTDNTRFSFQPLDELVRLLTSGATDGAFIMLSADSPLIAELARRDDLRIMNFPQAAAIAHEFPTLRSVVVPGSAYDLAANVPPADLDLVAGTVQVVVKKDLHPAIVYLLLEAMTEAHRAATIVSRDSEFPALRPTRLPVSEYAREYYQTGVPWVYKSLPLWLASVIGYYLVLIIPVLIVMPLYNWLGLPQLGDMLSFLRSSLWLRALRDLETHLQEGRPFTRADQATLRFIQASLEHPDRTTDCLRILERIRDRLAKTPALSAEPAMGGNHQDISSARPM